jgi:hypothetical protein
MISLTRIRTLDLAAATTAGRPLHLSAASGLACVGSFIYVVADDELHLGVFRAGSGEPGYLVRLFSGVLPEAKRDRKKHKPDLEALAVLPPHRAYPHHGALLALGSGSRRNRHKGAVLGLDRDGAVAGAPRVVDFSPLLAPLEDAFPALNIEGAVVSGGELRLFQRGNKRHAANALIRFPLSALLDGLNADRVAAVAPSAIVPIDLGEVEGIPLSFTDASALPDGAMVFTAVAEDTDNPYDDGCCAGAAVGIVEADGRLRCLHRLDRPHKVEGVDARVDGDVVRLLLVTDADDPAVPAGLFAATIAL